jgi:hypothetical protein
MKPGNFRRRFPELAEGRCAFSGAWWPLRPRASSDGNDGSDDNDESCHGKEDYSHAFDTILASPPFVPSPSTNTEH